MRIHVSSQHTTESDIHTPWQSPLQCFCSLFDCGSFESPKTKRDNAFQYVVLQPAVLRTSVSIIATMADSICKSTKKNGNNEGKGKKKIFIAIRMSSINP